MLKKPGFLARLRGKKKQKQVAGDSNENVVTVRVLKTDNQDNFKNSRNSSQASFTPSGDDVVDDKPPPIGRDITPVPTDDEEQMSDGETLSGPVRPDNTWIKADALLETFIAKHADEDRLFRAEFESMPAIVTSLKPKCEYARRPEFKEKNRYRNVVTCDESRVVLSKQDSDEYSDYINASYIDGFRQPRRFIAAQGPKDNTVNDFWRMIWERHCHVIVMITELWELGRFCNYRIPSPYQGQKKCEQYWPIEGSTDYGKVHVEMTSYDDYGSYIRRSFTISHCDHTGQAPRKVSHFQYRAWPDHGAPKTTSEIFRFHLRTLEAQPTTDDAGPILVHCSAGVGRTGTYIALDVLLGKLREEGSIDIFNLIVDLRLRRTEMVQSLDQYILLHKLVTEQKLYGHTDLNLEQFRLKCDALAKPDSDSGRSGFESQFELLANTCAINVRSSAGGTEQNTKKKNRDPTVLPYDHSKVFVRMRPTEQLPPYVNASMLQGYDVKQQIVVTQSPMEDTVEDFWRAAIDNNVTCVVMLTPFKVEEEELCFPHFPESGAAEYGDINVQLDATRDHDAFEESTLTVKGKERDSRPQTIAHLRLAGWDAADSLEAESRDGLLEVIEFAVDHVKRSQSEGSKPRMLVHCPDGAGRSGVLISLHNCIERIKREKRVDVFRSVKDARDYRPLMVRTAAQFRLCYEILDDYVKQVQPDNGVIDFKTKNDKTESSVEFGGSKAESSSPTDFTPDSEALDSQSENGVSATTSENGVAEIKSDDDITS